MISERSETYAIFSINAVFEHRIFCIFVHMVEVNGTIDRVIFHNAENGYSVLDVTFENVGKNYTVVCKGMLEPRIGTTYHFSGEWKLDKYGHKLDVQSYEEILPSEVDAIEKYLASGLVRGIGPAFAKQIVHTLGKETFEVIESKSNRIFEVRGVGKKRAESIWAAWEEHRYIRSLVSFLREFDISMNFIVKIYHRYGDESIEIIKSNPYRLVHDIDGLGFTRVDRLALKMGYERTGKERCMAGIKYELLELSADGHVYYEETPLIQLTAILLEIDNEYVEEALRDMICEGYLIKEDKGIYLPNLYEDEVSVANKLSSMTFYNAPKVECDIEHIESLTGVQYDEVQRNGIKTMLGAGVSVITGGPGTGKTTILLGAIKALQERRLTIAAAAPTGKAAKRMAEVTGLDAKTIHRLLSYNPDTGYEFNEQNNLSYDVVIIDEVSMVNIQLMAVLLNALSYSTKLILVGDVDQLPAIGPGNVLLDIINSGVIPVVRLTKIYRQAENSDIVVNAHRVNNGLMPNVKNSKPNTDFFFIKETNYDSIQRMIPELVRDRLPSAFKVNPYDIQVLSPMRKNEIGSINLNVILQEALNPNGPSVTYGSTIFRLGDKVMQIKNNYEKGIFNGETGKIIDVNLDMKSVTVDFDGNIIDYEQGDFDEIVLAYASTIHKSQGSEYPIVVIPIVRGHYNMMQRNLIYTAITRARNICVIIGDTEMVQRAVGNVNAKHRNTKLCDRLKLTPKNLI